MKKTKVIQLVLITSVLASCNKHSNEWTSGNGNNVYMRSDTTAPYNRVIIRLWRYAFRPYGLWDNGIYHYAGRYSEGISEVANIGGNSFKGGIVRGGFGGSHGFGVSS